MAPPHVVVEGHRIHFESFFCLFPGHHKPVSQQKNRLYGEIAEVRQVGAVTWKTEILYNSIGSIVRVCMQLPVTQTPHGVKAWLHQSPLANCLSCSVQLFQYRWDVDQAKLTAKIADDGRIVQNEDLPGRLGFLTLPQVNCL